MSHTKSLKTRVDNDVIGGRHRGINKVSPRSPSPAQRMDKYLRHRLVWHRDQRRGGSPEREVWVTSAVTVRVTHGDEDVGVVRGNDDNRNYANLGIPRIR